MKRKSLILLPLLVLGSAAFASCEPKEPPVVVDPSKVASVEFASDADITVKMGKYAEVPAVTVLPETATDKTYSLSISDETVAVLEEEEGTWYVKGVATGTATITVKTTDGEFTDTLTVVVPERDPAPAAKVATVTELVAKSADDTENLYKVTGVLTEVKGDKYGNLYLAEADGSAQIMVYGSTLAASSITWTDYTETNYVGLTFTNPQDFVTGGLKDKIAVGDIVTMVCVYKCYNGTDEIMGYVLEDSIVKAADNAVYSASLSVEKVGDLGGATLSKETGIYYSEELTVTVEAVEGYKTIVKANGLVIPAASEGVYKFNAEFTNTVVVTYEEIVENQGPINVLFDLGADGTASHYDGSEGNKSFTSGNYTLTVTNVQKTYYGARDAKGQSCLKLGTSSAVGKFTINVPEEVTSVIFYISGYKTRTANVKIDGVTYTASTTSDSGNYTAITVDTTSLTSLTFETTSTQYRVMINSIEYVIA